MSDKQLTQVKRKQLTVSQYRRSWHFRTIVARTAGYIRIGACISYCVRTSSSVDNPQAMSVELQQSGESVLMTGLRETAEEMQAENELSKEEGGPITLLPP